MDAGIASVIVGGLGVIGTIVVAAMQIRTERYRKKRIREEAVERERRDDELQLAILRGMLIKSTGELANVTSIAVTGGHTNGNVEQAQSGYLSASSAYDTFETTVARKYLRRKESTT